MSNKRSNKVEGLPVVASEPNFSDIARNILKKSIRSAVCIDDSYPSAYFDIQSAPHLKFDEAKTLYDSFRSDGFCDIDIYNYTNYEDSCKEYVFYNKDLLVLDWELDQGGGHAGAVQVLKRVIDENKIPFVLIYTNTADLHQVTKELIANFNGSIDGDYQSACSKIQEKISQFSVDAESLDVVSSFEDIQALFYEYIHYYDRRDNVEKDIIEKLFISFDINTQHREDFIRILKRTVSGLNGGKSDSKFLELAYAVCKGQVEEMYQIHRVETSCFAYKINGTTVLVFHKDGQQGGIKPDDLFATFSDVIVNNPFNFISLLALEFKDSLRDDFSKIGLGFSSIDERAFFYHLSNYKKEDGNFNLRTIYDFILNSWIGELHSQKMALNSDVLKYFSQRHANVSSSFPAEIEKDISFLKGLVSYASFISNSSIEEREDFTLKFGDVFVSNDKKSFFLSITPHCDCVRPNKIKHNFFFIEGKLMKDKIALEKAETGYYSFFANEVLNDPISVEWTLKPFTSYIPYDKNNVRELEINYQGKVLKLNHLTVLKENYTQRISNASFGHGFRVGIDLPHIYGS